MGEWKGNIGMDGSDLFKPVSVEDVLLFDIYCNCNCNFSFKFRERNAHLINHNAICSF